MIDFELDMILTSVFWGLLALLFAILEIENEGKFGWAEKSQTWYRSKEHQPKIIQLLLGGKPLTGYHLFLFPLVMLITHAHFFMGVSWTLDKEFAALGIYFLWSPLWDYLWIVFNPHFSVSKIKEIWWFKKEPTIFIFPFSDFAQWVLSFVVVVIGALLTGNNSIIFSHLEFVAYISLFALFVSFVVSPYYKKWYWEMRRFDDRESSLT